MIVIGKDKTLDNYFIDENGVITDEFGTIQKTTIKKYEWFKGTRVHQIQLWTNYGWRNTKNWVIHHKDENKLNNSISNLVYLTRSEHSQLHYKNKSSGQKNHAYGKHWKLSPETKRKISLSKKGQKFSEEARKNMSLAHLGKDAWNKGEVGRHWYNDGIKNYLRFPNDEEIKGMKLGRLNIN